MNRIARRVKIGSIVLGGGAPVRVQAMTKTDTCDFKATQAQLNRLCAAGAELIRLAVPNDQAAGMLGAYVNHTPVPLIADIHFDYRLALKSLAQGVAKVRINPGTMGSDRQLAEVARAAKDQGAAIRIGLNAGSAAQLESAADFRPWPEILAESALHYCENLEKLDFHDLVLAVKSSSLADTIAIYRRLAERTDYPLHIGVTEGGIGTEGLIRVTLGIGILLHQGIGETIRVSLTADPVDEVAAGWRILQELGLRQAGPRLISCPMCGRCRVPLIGLVEAVREMMAPLKTPITVAIMGCEVNGPGEARQADIGLAFGRDAATLFVAGKALRKVAVSDSLQVLREYLDFGTPLPLLREEGRLLIGRDGEEGARHESDKE